MRIVESERDPMGQVLVLSPGCDATGLQLTAAEGYLLSRIDGRTSWHLLREIGGAPPADVDACLARWIEKGLLEVLGEPRARATSLPVEIDEEALDHRLELDLSVQRRILEFEGALGLPYHELLGVPPGSDPKVVKRAYFKLSKEFHPDRYFRREIGGYAARLERIFKKVLEAHEMLSDPELCRVENQPPREVPASSREASEAPPRPVASECVKSLPESSARPEPRPLTKLERLRQRMPFKIDHAAIAQRRVKADEIFRAASASQKAGRLQEAEASVRIAISFDPSRVDFKEALGDLRLEAAGNRATRLLAKASDRMSEGELREVLTVLEDVLLYRPHDPQLNDRAARFCLQLGKFKDAEDYARVLIERSPDVAAHHALLGLAHRAQGRPEAAQREFETALELDEDDMEARRALAALRIGHHDAVQGGRR